MTSSGSGRWASSSASRSGSRSVISANPPPIRAPSRARRGIGLERVHPLQAVKAFTYPVAPNSARTTTGQLSQSCRRSIVFLLCEEQKAAFTRCSIRAHGYQGMAPSCVKNPPLVHQWYCLSRWWIIQSFLLPLDHPYQPCLSFLIRKLPMLLILSKEDFMNLYVFLFVFILSLAQLCHLYWSHRCSPRSRAAAKLRTRFHASR